MRIANNAIRIISYNFAQSHNFAYFCAVLERIISSPLGKVFCDRPPKINVTTAFAVSESFFLVLFQNTFSYILPEVTNANHFILQFNASLVCQRCRRF